MNDTPSHDHPDRPLEGVRVVDLSVTLPGPFASQILRRLGASVLHLEPPAGDSLRLMAPAAHAFLAEGKESVAVDLKQPPELALALDLLAEADVVVEGWRPGVADRLGVGYAAVSARNPRVVYCSLSGYGRDSLLRGRAGHDINYVAESGAAEMLTSKGMPVGDLAGSSAAATRILAELLRAARTGHGAHLDVSITGTLADWVDALGGTEWWRFVDVLQNAHYGHYETKDGERLVLGIAPMEQRLWANAITAFGRPDWASLSYDERLERHDEIVEFLAKTVASMTADELQDALAAVDTCWSLVRRPGAAGGLTGRMPNPPGTAPALDEHGRKYREGPRRE
ncbi:CoA transferase [Jiangella endophytica]|uniref:CoA transferase n=1 Tax=Jiangella endophytica TaxID=1623398 RepID=UPI00130020AB|nr:CaiB/BaiF CoA-transferase family protein [Jiangella endophytica]